MTAGSYCYIGPQGIVHGTTVSTLIALILNIFDVIIFTLLVDNIERWKKVLGSKFFGRKGFRD